MTGFEKGINLGRRATAGGWEWMDGARWMTDTSRYGARFGRYIDGGFEERGEHVGRPLNVVPDMHDAATQGIALALIAKRNGRSSTSDALRDLAHAVGRGVPYHEALVEVLEATR